MLQFLKSGQWLYKSLYLDDFQNRIKSDFACFCEENIVFGAIPNFISPSKAAIIPYYRPCYSFIHLH